MKYFTRILVVAALSLLSGCIVPLPPGHRVLHHGPPVGVFVSGHVHSTGCGHYLHGAHWYAVGSHHHGPRCGHVVRRGVWATR